MELPPGRLGQFSGSYRRASGDQVGFTATVAVDGGGLVFRDHFGRETPLAAIGASRFAPSAEAASGMVF